MQNLLSSFTMSNLWNVLLVVGYVVAGTFIMMISRRLYQLYYLRNQSISILELVPPSRGDKTAEATNQLFLSLYGLGNTKKFYERVIGRQSYFTLEIVALRAQGIRYIIKCEKAMALTIEHMVASYTPDIKVSKIEDYKIATSSVFSKVLEFKQKSHFAYPLKTHDLLESHDPISYITNAMTKLDDGEFMSLQLIIKPTRSRTAEALRKKIMTNEDLMPKMGRRRILVAGPLLRLVNTLLFGIADIFTTTYHGQGQDTYKSQSKDLEYKKQVASGIKPARTLSYFEHELVESISQKLQQPLFQVDLRLLIQVATKKEYTVRRKNIESALSLYAVPRYQRLGLRTTKHHFMSRYAHYAFKHRLPSLFASHSNIFSVSEVASLYHFPNTQTAKTENVVKSLSKTLPAPISLKGSGKLDILLGENIHQGTSTKIGLTEAERERHVYIIGGTGNGKTTMLLYGIVQDIQNGKGIAVLDPHGDLAETILQHIPQERINDVIYLNPDDLTYPIGINLLELQPGLVGDELLREKDLITESTISVLRKVFSEDDSGGHRIEYILRNTIQTALTMEGSTLFTIFRLLNDNKYRREAVKKLEDGDLKNFWNNELGKAGDFQKVKMAAGITAKIGRFLFSASAKRILEQEKSTIDFDDILNSGKILICNFSKGLLGEDTSTLFGTTILAKLQVASLRRARIKQANRRPFYLYVDEFQNFATMSFVQMLSEARKYKLFLTMAEQSTSQQDEQRLVDIILANVGTVICFRSGSPADERLVLPLFFPYIEQGEIANLPSFNFYARIAAIHSQEPMSGITVLLQNKGSESIAEQVIKSSRINNVTRVPVTKPELQAQESVVAQVQPVKRKKQSHIITASKRIEQPIG
jgi:hypothetical protein